MPRKYLLSVCTILCILLSGCGAQAGSAKDMDTVPQSKEEIQSSSEITEDFSQQEITNTTPLFSVEMEDEYPRGTQIGNQTFDVELRPFGEVTFASYTPDTWNSDYADAVFLIEQNGTILSQLPAAFENNIGTESFHSVDAVSFLDYNKDGFDDIILILSYIPNDGQSTLHTVVRYYRGGENGIFTYEQEMSENASSALANITVASAKDFIGYKDLSYNDNSADEADIYKHILEQYQDMVRNDFYKNLIDLDDYDTSFGDAIGWEIRHLVQDIYYAFYDIDGNGTAESGVDFYIIGTDGFTPEKIDSISMIGHLEGDVSVFDYSQNGNAITEDEYNSNIQSYEIALEKELHWIQIQ